MQNIVIIAAPFGYGPAAKAIRIANAFSDTVNISIISKGDAGFFIQKHISPRVNYISGSFMEVYQSGALNSTTCYISLNNDVAVEYLVAEGLQDSAIFVDSLLMWRMNYAPPKWRKKISAYLVEDFPGIDRFIYMCNAKHVIRVAPIIYGNPDVKPDESGQRYLCMSFGGMTSPLVHWGSIKNFLQLMLDTVVTYTSKDLEIRVIGNSCLHDLTLADKDRVIIHSDISPLDSYKLIRNSLAVLSTPGLGVINESLVAEVPIGLLPPLNSTQIFNLRCCYENGISIMLKEKRVHEITSIGSRFAWSEQTRECLKWLHNNREIVIGDIRHYLEIDQESILNDYIAAIDRQKILVNSLYKNNGVEVLKKLVSGF